MTKLYLLAIPVVIGIIAGMFLVFYPESENDSNLLTTSKLIENGSPIMGDSNAPITVLELEITNVRFVTDFIKTL